MDFRAIKDLVIKLCKKRAFRALIFPVIKLAGKKTYVERLLKIEAEEKYFLLNKNRIVLDGPFKGMKYPALSSFGSELAPKIIGSYEMELNGIIEAVIHDPSISEIIDVGSAEGYYAVGFAMRKAGGSIFAYDIKKEAIDLCKSMADVNAVPDRIQYGSFCSDETLKNFKFKNRGFVMSDCEGYELKLFNESNLPNLVKCDVLIEMHDFIDPQISNYLKKLFSKTHDIKIIKSEKRDPEKFPTLSGFTKTEQKLILSECRIGILDEGTMEWLYARSRVG